VGLLSRPFCVAPSPCLTELCLPVKAHGHAAAILTLQRSLIAASVPARATMCGEGTSRGAACSSRSSGHNGDDVNCFFFSFLDGCQHSGNRVKHADPTALRKAGKEWMRKSSTTIPTLSAHVPS
jgi:hypothetical protein